MGDGLAREKVKIITYRAHKDLIRRQGKSKRHIASESRSNCLGPGSHEYHSVENR